MSRARDPVRMEPGPSVEHLSPLPPRPRRPKLGRAKRARVLARDGHRCRDCGSREDLTLDHVVPLSKGGSSRERNLRSLCRRCNQARGDSGAAPQRRRGPSRLLVPVRL